MRTIRKLSDEARSSIRSAYIITSVQQLTRELLDNAIDAECTQIQLLISLDDWSIKLTDNGIGIQKDSLAELGRSHMSSKKGSKGETLASISQLASLKITTRHVSALSTHTLITRGGHSVYFGLSVDGNRSSRGTTVTVTDIFANLPVRRKSLSKAREIHGIRLDIQSFALMHPKIAFEMRNSQQILLKLPPVCLHFLILSQLTSTSRKTLCQGFASYSAMLSQNTSRKSTTMDQTTLLMASSASTVLIVVPISTFSLTTI